MKNFVVVVGSFILIVLAGCGGKGSVTSDLVEGVTIHDLEVGSGDVVEHGDEVRVGYVGSYILNSREVIFEHNMDDGNLPFSFRLGSGAVIPGFDQGVTGMRVGGYRLLIISPEMSYGDLDLDAIGIPSRTNLRFLVRLYEAE